MPAQKIETILTVEEVAKVVKLHPYIVRRLIREGKISAFKFGGQWRFDLDKINKLKNKNKYAITC